jgi:hypothetical protein
MVDSQYLDSLTAAAIDDAVTAEDELAGNGTVSGTFFGWGPNWD